MVVEDIKSPFYDGLHLDLLLFDAFEDVLQLWDGTVLVDELFPVREVQFDDSQ